MKHAQDLQVQKAWLVKTGGIPSRMPSRDQVEVNTYKAYKAQTRHVLSVCDRIAGGTVEMRGATPARGVQMEDGFVIKVLGRYHWLDHKLHQILVDLVIGDICRQSEHA